jgi:hypothetical protein
VTAPLLDRHRDIELDPAPGSRPSASRPARQPPCEIQLADVGQRIAVLEARQADSHQRTDAVEVGLVARPIETDRRLRFGPGTIEEQRVAVREHVEEALQGGVAVVLRALASVFCEVQRQSPVRAEQPEGALRIWRAPAKRCTLWIVADAEVQLGGLCRAPVRRRVEAPRRAAVRMGLAMRRLMKSKPCGASSTSAGLVPLLPPVGRGAFDSYVSHRPGARLGRQRISSRIGERSRLDVAVHRDMAREKPVQYGGPNITALPPSWPSSSTVSSMRRPRET